jgi:hypothetical protein
MPADSNSILQTYNYKVKSLPNANPFVQGL